MFGVSIGESSFTDFDFAMMLMLPSWLNSTTFFSQPSLSLRRTHLNLACMEVNWQKTKFKFKA